MSFSITDWNLNPNILWYIRLEDTGSLFNVHLFTNLTDAQADTNIYAQANDIVFGTDVEIVLVLVDETDLLSFFNEQLTYHLKVSGIDGDTTKIFKVNPFIDLPDINNGIYRSENLIQLKAISEINIHTHIKTLRDVGLGNHIPALKVGDVCRLNSSRLILDSLTNIEEVIIMGTADSLINQIGTVEYMDLNYG